MANPVDYHLPGDFIDMIKSRPTAEIRDIFSALTQKKLAEIPGCTTTEQLLQVQAQARYTQELEQFFLAEMLRK